MFLCSRASLDFLAIRLQQGQYASLKEKYDQLLVSGAPHRSPFVHSVFVYKGARPVTSLQETSRKRRKHLASLYDYLQSCRKELDYLSQQKNRILQRDWSDRMVDPPSVRMEYEVSSVCIEKL